MFGKVSARDVRSAGLQRSAKAPQAKTVTPQQEDDLLVQQTLRNNAPLDARQVQALGRNCLTACHITQAYRRSGRRPVRAGGRPRGGAGHVADHLRTAPGRRVE